jgi:hypothetical protein
LKPDVTLYAEFNMMAEVPKASDRNYKQDERTILKEGSENE